MSGAHLSKEFYDLVRSIGESKSKQEEDKIISKEVTTLKARFQERNLSKARLKECLIRLIYVEMLGHDGSFGYVHAVQLTASANLLQKRVGYLCASLTLSPEHEFRFMLINQLQRDLSSPNMLEICCALIALCKLITDEMIPAVLPNVARLLQHDESRVRKKAALALHRMHLLNPKSVNHLLDSLRQLLCDKDPSVMAATLCLLYELAKVKPQENKDLIPTYVTILKQIVDKNIPDGFNFYHVPAPWMQIKLLKILATLGQNDKQASEQMYEVLHECLKQAKNTTRPIGFAVMYEFVRTTTIIYPNNVLLDSAADAISLFIKNDNHNLKYLGVTGLASIVRDHPRYAANHQLVVLDCLEDSDETLKRKTLDLLFRMTNPINVQVIVGKLLQFLERSTDKFLRKDLVSRISNLAERYSPNNLWYVKTIVSVLYSGGELAEAEVAQNLIKLLANGDDDTESSIEEANEMRQESCEIFIEMLSKHILPEILLQVMFWTIGQYGHLLGEETLESLIDVIVRASDRPDLNLRTRRYALFALVKTCSRLYHIPALIRLRVQKNCSSIGVILQQRAKEFYGLMDEPTLLKEVLQELRVGNSMPDSELSFLNGYVKEMTLQGALEYNPPDEVDDLDDDVENEFEIATQKQHLRYDPYEKPQLPQVEINTKVDISNTDNIGVSQDEGFKDSMRNMEPGNVSKSGLNLRGVKSVWDSSGYSGEMKLVKEEKKVNGTGLTTETSPPTAYALYEDDSPKQPVERSELSDIKLKNREMAAQADKTLSDREKLARALFEGVSTESEGTQVKEKKKPISKHPKSSSVQNSHGAIEDLLGIESSGITTSDTMVDFQSSKEEIDLLGALDPMSQTNVMSSTTKENTSKNLVTGECSAIGLEPLNVSTEEFGKNWISLTSEKKVTLRNPNSCDFIALTKLIKKTLSACIVEIITETSEGIFAIRKSSEMAFIHAKQKPSFSPLSTDVTLRTTNEHFTAELFNILRQWEA